MLYILLSSWPQKLIGLVSSENSLQWLLGFCFWDLTDNCRAMNYFFPNCIILHVLTLKPVYYVFCCPLMKQCVIVLKCTPISWEFPQQKLLTGFWNLEVFYVPHLSNQQDDSRPNGPSSSTQEFPLLTFRSPESCLYMFDSALLALRVTYEWSASFLSRLGSLELAAKSK